jgi:ubiquinone/menaquinone biosynthesis C-methylase UbiE
MPYARYDGNAEWYDQTFVDYSDLRSRSSSSSLLAHMLGTGSGWCLDVACGTGLHFQAIESTGRRVLGVDLSRDQLQIAHRRASATVCADASRLPFPAESFPTSVSTYLHTDTDDIAAAFTEIARVLQPGGRFIYIGVHPCFRGHFVEIHPDRRIVHDGYWERGWHTTSPHRNYTSIRERVGSHHIPLADLLNALISSGLRLTTVQEAQQSEQFADQLALVAIKD